MNEMLKAKIKAIYLHPTQKVPVVFVTDSEEQYVLPMVIGFLEAQAIITAWQKLKMPRPVTADLLLTIIEDDFKAQIEKIVIRDLQAGAFLASIHLRLNGEVKQRDSRPSDALALAVRTKAPIFISQDLLEKIEGEQENAKAMLDFLEQESEDSDEILKF